MDEEIVRRMFSFAHSVVLSMYNNLPEKYTFGGESWSLLKRGGQQWFIKNGTVDDESMQIVEFGTTAVCVLKWATVLIIAHTGDSKCVVGQVYPDRRLGTIEMTIDHNLDAQPEGFMLS
jgi:serine/threonine protein phosphatase PrpC